MPGSFEWLVAPALRVAVALASSVLIYVLSGAAAWLIGRLFPVRAAPGELRERERLAAGYRAELEQIAGWEKGLSAVFLLAFPVIFHQLSLWLIEALAGPGARVLFRGAMIMAIPHMVAGAFFGAALVPALIDARFLHPHAANLRALYRHSEERQYGLVGRYAMTRPALIAGLCLLVPIAAFGNNYTVVDRQAVDYPPRLLGSARVRVPHTEVARLIQVRWRDGSGKQKGTRCYAVYRDGRVLSSDDGLLTVGALASWLPRQSASALRYISELRGLPVEEKTLPVGQQPDLAVQAPPTPPEVSPQP